MRPRGAKMALFRKKRTKKSATGSGERKLTRQATPSTAPAPTLQNTTSPLPGTSVGVPRNLAKYGLGSWYIIGIAIVVSMVVFALARISFIFVAIFLALVFTSVLRPITDFFDRWMPRVLAMLVAVILLTGLFGGLMTYVVYSVQGEWDELADQFSEGIDSLIGLLDNPNLPWSVTADEVREWLASITETGMQWLESNTGRITEQIMSSASAIGTLIMIISLALMASIFFIMSGKNMWLWFINLLPEHNREKTHEAATVGWIAFSGYARGTIIVATLDGILAFFLLLILGVPLAAPLAVLVTIGAFIPLFGAPIAMIIATVVAFAANGPLTALIVLLGVALIGQLEGDVFQPLVMGKQVNLHPVVIAVGVMAGTFLAGLTGAIIAIPILSVIWAVFKVLYEPDEPLDDLPEIRKNHLPGA